MVNRMSYLVSQIDAVGTSAGSPELIDNQVTPSDTVDVLAIILQNVHTGVNTAGEANQGQFTVNWRTLANEEITYPSAVSVGGAPATNIAAYVIPAQDSWNSFLPKAQAGQQGEALMGNKKVTSKYDANTPEPTAEMAAQAVLVTVNSPLMPSDIMKTLDGHVPRYSWSEKVNQADIKTVAQVFTNSITVPGWVKEIIAAKIQLAPDAALTANEFALGFLEFGGTVPGVNGFVQLPFSVIGGNLGTPVGGYDIDRGTLLPLWIDMRTISADSTISFTSNLLVALGAALACTVTLYGR